MSTEDGTRIAPRIVDPGGDGWPEAPKVTQAEAELYGLDYAPAIRLLGNGAVAVRDGYSLLCKALEMDPFLKHGPLGLPPDEEAKRMREADAFSRETIQAAYQLYENASQVFRELAEKCIARQRQFYERRNEAMAREVQFAG